MLRPIAAFRLDDEGHWVAELACGHTRHVRHRPPWQVREWVTTEEGRASMLGHPLDCVYCDIPALPDTARAYKRTPEWTQDTLPAALQSRHDTRADVWARIVVLEGRVTFEILGEQDGGPERDDGERDDGERDDGERDDGAGDARSWVLRPGIDGVAPPRVPHQLSLCGPVRLYVELLRC